MFKQIVVGTGGSATAANAVHAALELAQTVKGDLVIVSAYPEESPRRPAAELEPSDIPMGPRVDAVAIVDAAEQEAQGAGVAVDMEARVADPADVLLSVAEDRAADLIVVGNRGMTGVQRFLLGSVPNKISHHAPCSVLIVHTT
jgi:nucleotide-binding universal stress UspA family protein